MRKLIESDLLERTAADIKADKQAWLDRKERNRVRADQASRAYYSDQMALFEPIKDKIINLLSKYNLLDIDVRVERYYGEGVRVTVNCNENRHDDSTSLRWDYKAVLADGELKKETGSWSGLQACTPAQIDHLKQSVSALEDLNSLDWKSILDVPELDWANYKYEKEDETPEYDYDTELKFEQLREIIGQDKAVEFKHPKLEKLFWGWRRNTYFLQVTKLSPKNVKGFIYVRNGDGALENTSHGYDENFTLDQFTIGDEVIDL